MSDDEAKLISFLQRSEVRLSTMHRIAGLFLNGAGLLIVLPIFFRDTFFDVIDLARHHTAGGFQYAMFALLAIMVAVPTLAMFLLLRDLVDFYFVMQPSASRAADHAFSLRFGLSALGLPTSSRENFEQDRYKSQVTEIQQGDPAMLDYVLPHLRENRLHYERMLTESSGTIIPASRRAACGDDQKSSYLYAAFGLAGLTDRSLVEEAAWAEAALVRHVLTLRRLVLRYVKSLLVLMWTMGVLLVASRWVTVTPHIAGTARTSDIRVSLSVSAGFFLWARVTPMVIRFPVKWIHGRSARGQRYDTVFRDRDLVSLN
jgi:hypothetical protein